MSAQAALTQFHATRNQPSVLASEAFADGTAKRLMAAGDRFSVLLVQADGAPIETLIDTEFSEVAGQVYDACAGRQRPWHPTYLPRGTHGTAATKTVGVLAAGITPEDCVRGFLDSIGNTLKKGSLEPYDEDGPKDEFQWCVRFADTETGTAFKAAGRFVPGGAVMTWWK